MFFSKKNKTPKILDKVAPYTLTFHLEPHHLILQGYVPSRESRIELRDLAFALFPGRDVVDRLKLARGEPIKWRDASIDLLVFLKRFQNANATIIGRDILLQVDKSEGVQTREIKSQLGLLVPNSYTLLPLQATKAELVELGQELQEDHLNGNGAVITEVQVETEVEENTVAARETKPVSAEEEPQQISLVERCQADFSKVLKSSKIEFQSGSSEIKSQSSSLLDTLASIATSCDGLNFEIIGHTDSRGDELFNKILSKSRAETVLDALKQRGIVAEKMLAKGMGSEEPLVSNDSNAGKAKNRRVEILVKKSLS